MNRKIKFVLLGHTLILFGIWVRNIYIGYLYTNFTKAIWWGFPILGFLFALYGLFIADE